MEDKDLFILHGCHACLWPGEAWGQGISSNGIDLIIPEYLVLAAKELMFTCMFYLYHDLMSGLILGLHPANERRHYKVTPSLIGCGQT